MTSAPKAVSHTHPQSQRRSVTFTAAKLIISATLLVVATALVAVNFGMSSILIGIGQLSVWTLCGILAALLANALIAALRLKIIANYIGYRLSFRQAMAAVSVGSLGGAAFFRPPVN
jgi:uncharacterized membrane protein YbhN (UPF0104 family)